MHQCIVVCLFHSAGSMGCGDFYSPGHLFYSIQFTCLQCDLCNTNRDQYRNRGGKLYGRLHGGIYCRRWSGGDYCVGYRMVCTTIFLLSAGWLSNLLWWHVYLWRLCLSSVRIWWSYLQGFL